MGPFDVKRLAGARVDRILERESVRARTALEVMKQRYPSAGNRELSQRFIDDKKQLAGMVGGVTGIFGVASVPFDLVSMAYLQLSLLVEVATVFKADVKTEHGRAELLDVFGEANGIGPLARASPRVLGSLAGLLLRSGGLAGLGRVVPLVAVPISAYLNNRHVQRVGDAAVRHYDGWAHAHEKQQRASDTANDTPRAKDSAQAK
ncbi:MAG: hypothetical protein JNG84_06825 [Archangium sp.]|nr:hypothetical protein [Archangium sp.]